MSRKRNKKINTLVSIIIPVYRRFDLLAKCLDAIPDAFGEIPFEVIMVDNASPVEEAKPFYDDYSQYIVIRNRENYGFPKACNQGANRSNSSLLFFLNSDVILDPGSGELLVKAMDDPIVGICGMKLVFPVEDSTQYGLMGPPGTIQHIGLSTTIKAQFVHHFGGWNVNHPKVNALRDVYAVTGAAMMVRKQIFMNHFVYTRDRNNQIVQIQERGFYEGYGLGTYEDVDLCIACRDIGRNVIVEPKAKGTHYTGATAREYGLGYNMQRNQMIFMQRWQEKLMYTEWNVL